MLSPSKPKLVFFRSPQEGLPFFIKLHLQEQVKCLSLFFEVTVIDQECDYGEICGRHEPDLCLFESGVYEKLPRRRIYNTSVRPDIPKLGFCHADAYCVTREVFLADMWEWGVESFFSSSAVMREYLPEIAKNLFVWPNFADGELYRDYGESKLIPVLFTGSRATHYPWRNRVDAAISQHYASFRSPHFGWFDASKTGRMIFGESYARLLNAAWAVPACGTIAREVVRKHFEIPAAKACLFAERTRSLEDAGFVDMHNCVFAEAGDIVDKLDYLFSHRDEFLQIIQNGYDLVHSKHLLVHRNEIYQWYELNKICRPEERIVQPGPFQPLALAPRDSACVHRREVLSGVDRILIRDGDMHRDRGEYTKAAELYMRCMAYHYIPEASLRLAMSKLMEGDVKAALFWLDKEMRTTVTEHGNLPDPVLWAYVIVAYLCSGQVKTAMILLNRYPQLRHPELSRVRQAVGLISGGSQHESGKAGNSDPHYSVHRLSERSSADWFAQLGTMLRACHQPELARALSGTSNHSYRAYAVPKLSIPSNSPDPVGRMSSETHLKRVFRFLEQIKRRGLGKCWGGLRQIEKVTKDFLPYNKSLRRRAQFSKTLESILKEEDFRSITVFGAVTGRIATDACIAVCSEKRPSPSLFCVYSKTPQGAPLSKYFLRDITSKSHRLSVQSTENRSLICDVAVIDGTAWDREEDLDLRDAKLVVLYDLSRKTTSLIHDDLRSNADYYLVAADLDANKGFVVYKRG